MLWIGLAFWVGSIAIMYILEWAGVEMAGQDNLFDLGKTMFQRLPIFTLLLFCLLQPILEEMSFRLWGVGKKWTLVLCLVLMAMFGVSSIGLLGLLFVVGIILVTVLVKDRFVQVWLNAILSSLLFSLCHISGFGNDVLGMTLGLSDIFGMALVCCWLTVNISFWLSCLLHVLNNSLSIILPLLFLPDVQTGRIIVSYEDSPNMQELATVIEPVRPFADNSALLAGAATQSELAAGAKDFYLVGEPAEIARMIASQRMGIPNGEARQLIQDYFATFPKVHAFMESAIATAREKKYAETMFGRRRYLPDIDSKNGTVRGFAERNAINAPIQGSEADIIKIAMIRIWRRFKEEGIRSKLILQVHDELNFSVYPEEKDKVENIVLTEMQNACKLSVPLIADAGWGKNWLEAH